MWVITLGLAWVVPGPRTSAVWLLFLRLCVGICSDLALARGTCVLRPVSCFHDIWLVIAESVGDPSTWFFFNFSSFFFCERRSWRKCHSEFLPFESAARSLIDRSRVERRSRGTSTTTTISSNKQLKQLQQQQQQQQQQRQQQRQQQPK